MTKDDGLASVIAGDGLSHAYTITVTNGGPSDADSVVLDDIVPGRPHRGRPERRPRRRLHGLGSATRSTAPCRPASPRWRPGRSRVPYTVGSAVPAQTVTNTAVATSAENPGGVSAADLTDVTGGGHSDPDPTPTPGAHADPKRRRLHADADADPARERRRRHDGDAGPRLEPEHGSRTVRDPRRLRRGRRAAERRSRARAWTLA